NLRGNLVPVLDFRKRLRAGSASSQEDRRILITHLDNRLVGLIVDRASEVIRVDESSIEAPPDMIVESGAEYITGIVKLGDRFVTLIDIVKALDGDIGCELDRVMEILSRVAGETAPPSKAVR
ncbi:MAG TPA: chemotaxis protein CheW, partial [Blastocatellia bacterium]|nr:chemotaxis protein CheW [Blastocatellia bacterium]